MIEQTSLFVPLRSSNINGNYFIKIEPRLSLATVAGKERLTTFIIYSYLPFCVKQRLAVPQKGIFADSYAPLSPTIKFTGDPQASTTFLSRKTTSRGDLE